MKTDKLIENVTEQIKEAQLKLGFAREVIRLYFPIDSLCRLLQMEYCCGQELLAILESDKEFEDTVLGRIRFFLCGNRIEVRISPEGADYVHRQVPDPPFLVSIIQLFRENHTLTIEEICGCFQRFDSHYVCERMEPGTDFDYVLYFADHHPDPWYYCIKMEMGHTIYHRFTKEDYQALAAAI